LAWALAASGDRSAARQAADRAKALDDAMPHADQKLNRQRIADWDASRPDAGFGYARAEHAEQTIETVRTSPKR
jgi:hypothetical protein